MRGGVSSLTAFLLAGLTACGGVDSSSEPDGGSEPQPDADDGPDSSGELDAAPAPSLAGTWRVVSGDLFAVGSSGVDTLDYIDLVPSGPSSPAGSGTVYGSSVDGLIGCARLVYSELGTDAVTLSAPELGVLDVRLVDHVDDDTVEITDTEGNTTELGRIDAVPAEAICEEAVVDDEIPLPVSPGRFVGLANDGSQLWYEGSDDTWVPLDPSNDTFGTPEPIPGGAGQFTHIHSFQDGDFWAHCGCGGSETARRIARADGSTVDEVDTSTLPTEIGVRGIAYNGTNLILSGFDREASESKILVIDTAPGTAADITSELVLTFTSGPIGLKGTELWTETRALGQALARFDPSTGNVLESVTLPDDVGIEAFAWVGDTIYALGRRGDGPDELLKISVP